MFLFTAWKIFFFGKELMKDYISKLCISGQVILDKNQKIKTVVNKLKTIDTEFRNFQMELLAGEKDFMTTVREHGCSFTFDFSKVYWNTKLGMLTISTLLLIM